MCLVRELSPAPLFCYARLLIKQPLLYIQEVFMAAVHVLAAMSAFPAGAEAVRSRTAAARQLHGVCQLLARRVETEQRYLLRLEGVNPSLYYLSPSTQFL